MPTGQAIVSGALEEIGVIGAGQTASHNLYSSGLARLNRMLDTWRTVKRYVYMTQHASYTFGVSQQSYLIGPSDDADFDAERPAFIDKANLIRVSATPDEHIPLQIIEVEDYSQIRQPATSAAEPYALYWQASAPDVTLYPFPYPTTTTNKLELYTRKRLESFTLEGPVNLPDGYENALVLSLAEAICPAYGVDPSMELKDQARHARAAIASLNSKPPRLNGDTGLAGISRSQLERPCH